MLTVTREQAIDYFIPIYWLFAFIVMIWVVIEVIDKRKTKKEALLIGLSLPTLCFVFMFLYYFVTKTYVVKEISVNRIMDIVFTSGMIAGVLGWNIAQKVIEYMPEWVSKNETSDTSDPQQTYAVAEPKAEYKTEQKKEYNPYQIIEDLVRENKK